jgi:porphobilinogen synthase
MTIKPEIEQFSVELPRRPRRNRKNAAIRSIVQETHLLPKHLVAPLFILEGENLSVEVPSMPGVYRRSIDLAVKEAIDLYKMGVRAIDLFPVIPPGSKDRWGSEAVREDNLLQRAVKTIKKEIPEMCVMVDVALDPYTDHGHDGIIDESGNILNDPSLQLLARMSLHAAAAGADVVAPSDMMDGRVGYIRMQLDHAGFQNVSILSYAAKYASAFYGPFRDALGSAPKFGDKKTYQMNPANRREALMECSIDEFEGADMLLIKPAMPYLDVIVKVREMSELPIGAYHVSGEYAMVMAAAQKGWVDADRIFLESLLSIKRAGADFILTYAVQKSVLSQLV